MNRSSRIRHLIPVAMAMALAATAAYAYDYMVTGAGEATESDQSAAQSEAESNAQNNLQQACSTGEVGSQSRIFDQCSPITDSSGNTLYVCSVNMSGMCHVGR